MSGFCAGDNIIAPCDASCATCCAINDPLTCSACSSGNPLSNGYCCDLTCTTCDGPSSSDCLSCTDSYLYQGQCLAQCPSKTQVSGSTCVDVKSCDQGYYREETTNSCKSCSSPCASCSGSTTCTSCISGYNLVGSNCEIQPTARNSNNFFALS